MKKQLEKLQDYASASNNTWLVGELRLLELDIRIEILNKQLTSTESAYNQITKIQSI